MYLNHVKRVFDVLFSLIVILILSWLWLLILIVYVVQFEFPIFFRQERIGKNEIPFFIYKLRTLRKAEDSAPMERRFWWGDLLRFLSLDEIPQLWNVLRGDMSVIGPRPLPSEYLHLYSETQKKRHKVRPGITGWAQVNGRNSITWSQKFDLDLYYVNHVSFRLDLIVLIRTIKLLLSFRKDVSLNEEKFKGN